MQTVAQNTRLHSRKVPAQFGFIQIVGDEGGRILDFSEAGFAFESFSPVTSTKTLQFWFSLNLKDRVEATGEVVWLDTFFFSSRRRHTRFDCDWSSDVCSSDLVDRDLHALDGEGCRLQPGRVGVAWCLAGVSLLEKHQICDDAGPLACEGLGGQTEDRKSVV